MPIIQLLVILVVVGVVLWLVNTLIPMDQKIKTVINVLVLLLVLLWLLEVFGVLSGTLGTVPRFK